MSAYWPIWFTRPFSESDGMDRWVNAYVLYLIGAHIQPLYLALQPDVRLGTLVRFATNAYQVLALLINEPALSLRGSKERARALTIKIAGLIAEDRLRREADEPVPLAEVAELSEGIKEFEAVLSTECGHLDLFFISLKRGLDTSSLLSEAEVILGTEAQRLLPQSARDDLREAGKCLVYGVATASGYHVFRAIEAVVMPYFEILEAPSPQKPSQRNVGRYITILESNALNSKIAGMLTHLKDHYRNPLMHPEIFLTIDEAADLFIFGQSAISRMLYDQRAERLKRG
jgi:hypothetical protein